MDIKNLKNLNSPKYRISIASVLLIGGGIVFLGLKSFGPSPNQGESEGVKDDSVRIDPTALRSSRTIEGPEVEDYAMDDDSEISRVYKQSREDDRQKALEGDGSFIFTLSPDKDEEPKESEELEGGEKEVAKPSEKTDIATDFKSDKPSVQKKPEEKKEKSMDGEQPVSFQEQLRNTKPVREEASPQKRADPLSQQRQIYRNSGNQTSGTNQLLSGILSKADFKYEDRDIVLEDKIGESVISTYSPELPEEEEKKKKIGEESGLSSRDEANDYARYIGSVETESVAQVVKVGAGDIFYTKLQIGVNTDEVSPIRAEILSGELAGAVLLGYPKRAGEKAIIELSTMSFQGNTYSIDAVALDLETKRTAMADDVDKHYARNMAYLTIASIISGYSSSLQNWEETTESGIGGETVKKQEKLDNFEDRVMVGVGEAGEELKSVFKDQINREPTVYVYPQDIAVMFMSDAIIGDNQ